MAAIEKALFTENTHFARGSITVQLTSCFTCLD